MAPKISGNRGGPGDKSAKRVQWYPIVFLVVIVGTALPLAYEAFERASNYLSRGYITLHQDDAHQMKGVFFSGEPWLVLCKDSSHKLPAKVVDALVTAVDRVGRLNALVAQTGKNQSTVSADVVSWNRFRVGVVKCDLPMPGGQNVYDRFKLKVFQTKNSPLVFTVANGERPTPVPETYVRDIIQLPSQQSASETHPGSNTLSPAHQAAQKLFDYVRGRVAPQVPYLTDSYQLKRECLTRPRCGIVISPGEIPQQQKATLHALVDKWRNVRFMVVNLENTFFSLAAKMGPLIPSGSSDNGDDVRFLFFRKPSTIAGDDEEAGGYHHSTPESKAPPPLTYARAYKHPFVQSGLDAFIDQATQPSVQVEVTEGSVSHEAFSFVPVKKLPVLKAKSQVKPPSNAADRRPDTERRKDYVHQRPRETRASQQREPKPSRQRDPLLEYEDDTNEPSSTHVEEEAEEIIDLDSENDGDGSAAESDEL